VEQRVQKLENAARNYSGTRAQLATFENMTNRQLRALDDGVAKLSAASTRV
jgi:DNA repair ATPase RecN